MASTDQVKDVIVTIVVKTKDDPSTVVKLLMDAADKQYGHTNVMWRG